MTVKAFKMFSALYSEKDDCFEQMRPLSRILIYLPTEEYRYNVSQSEVIEHGAQKETNRSRTPA